MLLARSFSYADAHRARLGVNYKQIPVNAPVAPVHTYSKDGVMRIENRTDPVYWPNSKGGPRAYPERYAPPSWYADGEIMRAAYEAHAEDDDFAQPGTLVREVMDDTDRDHLASNIIGHASADVSEDVQRRVIAYWSDVDADLGARVAAGLAEANGRSNGAGAPSATAITAGGAR